MLLRNKRDSFPLTLAFGPGVGPHGSIAFSWLIKSSPQDSGVKYAWTTIAYRGTASILAAYFAFCPVIGEAWFFTTSETIRNFGATTVSAQGNLPTVESKDQNAGFSSVKNMQTLALLEPTVTMTADRKAMDQDADIEIIDGEALSPEIGSSGTLADVIDAPGGDTISIYMVRSGDSVASIAKRFSVSENTIRWANSLKKGEALKVGDTLLILPVTGINYTVKKGDTLAGIEKRYKLSSDEISDLLAFNDLDPTSKLAIGDTLIIPGAELSETSSTTSTKGGSKVNTGAYTPSGSSNIVRDYFIRPLASSCRMSQGKHDKFAVDLACPIGTPIRAAASGTVQFAKYGWNGAFGNLIIIKHGNGTTTFYAHIKADGIAVSQGQTVSQGQIIGYVGSTGRSTGPHLHFEVRGGGNPGFDSTGSAWKK